MEAIKISKIADQFYLGGQHLPVNSEGEARKFFANTGRPVEFVEGQLPTGRPLTYIETQSRQIVNVEKRSDGFFLGGNKVADTEQELQKKFSQFEILFAAPKESPAKRFYLHTDNGGLVQVYDNSKTRVRLPESPLREMISYLKEAHGQNTEIVDFLSGSELNPDTED